MDSSPHTVSLNIDSAISRVTCRLVIITKLPRIGAIDEVRVVGIHSEVNVQNIIKTAPNTSHIGIEIERLYVRQSLVVVVNLAGYHIFHHTSAVSMKHTINEISPGVHCDITIDFFNN
jgi:hypothetical protein